VKVNKILKVMAIILTIVILVMISFVGIYVKDNGRMVNILKDNTKAMEFGVETEFILSMSDAKNTEYYDKDGNLVPEEDVDKDAKEGTYTTKEVPVNADEVKNADNYKKVKEIMEQRINDLGLEEYQLTVNEETGDVVLKTDERAQAGQVLYAIYGQGEFFMKDAETGEVLLNNEDLKEALVGYYAGETGTSVYLTLQFDKEGTEKLKNVSSTYVQTTETKDVTAEDGTVKQEESTVTKNVDLYIDGNKIVSSYFGEPIENGQLQLTMGQATTNAEELQEVLTAASVEATKLSYGPLPLVYEVTNSANILSNFDKQAIVDLEVVGVVVATLVLVYFVIRYKERAIMAGILFLGFTALYLLVNRYANVPITAASILGFTFVEIFVAFFINRLLYRLKHYDANEDTPKAIINKSLLKAIMVMVPALIIAVIFSMFTWLPINSFGIVLFWGILLYVIYSYVFAKTLLLDFEYLFENK